MKQVFIQLFAWVAVLTSLISVLLLTVFLLALTPSLSIDGPSWISISPAWLINVLLITAFGLQHSIMARPWFKTLICKVLPESMERSLYVFASGVVLGVLPFLWQPMPAVIWQVDGAAGQVVVYALFAAGVVLTLAAVMAIDALDLLGFRQSGVVRQKPMTFQRGWLHNRVRHPIYTGLILVCWVTPFMTAGHLFFAICLTVYIRVGIFFEERYLVRCFGDEYREYIGEVPMLVPFLKP